MAKGEKEGASLVVFYWPDREEHTMAKRNKAQTGKKLKKMSLEQLIDLSKRYAGCRGVREINAEIDLRERQLKQQSRRVAAA